MTLQWEINFNIKNRGDIQTIVMSFQVLSFSVILYFSLMCRISVEIEIMYLIREMKNVSQQKTF